MYAAVLNRGLRPTIGRNGELDLGEPPSLFRGEHVRVTPALERAVRVHELAIKRLVIGGWTPEVTTSRAAPAKPPARPKAGVDGDVPYGVCRWCRGGSVGEPCRCEKAAAGERTEDGYVRREFDRAAEAAVRELYAIDYGVRWKGDKLVVFPEERSDRLTAVWRRVKPLWDRVVRHLTLDGGLLQFRRADPHPQPVVLWMLNHNYRPGNQAWWNRHHDHWFDTHPPHGMNAWRVPGEADWRMLWGRWVQEHRYAKLEWKPWGSR